MTVQAQVMALSSGSAGTIITFTAGATFTSAATASAMLASLNLSITNVNSAVARLGTGAKSLESHYGFIDKLQDTLTASVGNLVDADVAQESAKLIAPAGPPAAGDQGAVDRQPAGQSVAAAVPSMGRGGGRRRAEAAARRRPAPRRPGRIGRPARRPR